MLGISGAPSEEMIPVTITTKSRTHGISRVLVAGLMRRGAAAALDQGAEGVGGVDQLCQLGVGKVDERLAHVGADFGAELLQVLAAQRGDLDQDDAAVVAGAAADDEAAAFEFVDELGDGRLGESLGGGQLGDPAGPSVRVARTPASVRESSCAPLRISRRISRLARPSRFEATRSIASARSGEEDRSGCAAGGLI